ncbi:MAG: radical SAM protein [Candidatus Gracilibacteria bacterium]|nr:radical SAM protein [Candidatus Gracilibacteria bacterium]
MDKFNIILHTTTTCNYNCSYCDVIKNNKTLSDQDIEMIVNFINKNYKSINSFKFFGGEPLLVWKNIKYIIEKTHKKINNQFEIVTNTSILNDEILNYFKIYFSKIFFSIDSEKIFDYEEVFSFIDKYNLEDKTYFNLIISPKKEETAYNQFIKIYNNGYKNFNILPVYFTKNWEKENLLNLSTIMKKILDKAISDKQLKLYGFQSNKGYNSSLINGSLFINTDLKVYFSDIVSTHIGAKIKDKLFLCDLDNLSLDEKIDMKSKTKEIEVYEKVIIKDIKGQMQLHELMDYFSKYLNNKNEL